MAGEILVVAFFIIVLALMLSGDGGDNDRTEDNHRKGGDRGSDGGRTDTSLVDGEEFDTDTSDIEKYSPIDR